MIRPSFNLEEIYPELPHSSSKILPNDYIRVLHPEPGSEHPSIGTSHRDNRAALSSR